MIPLSSGTKIWLVAGITDMRNGFNGLAAKVQTTLKDDPMSGHVFIFRGRNGSQVKLLWSTGDGLCLLARVLISKYAEHTPLYRQSEMYGRQGVELSRSLLSGWVDACCRLLSPLEEAL